MFKKSLLIAAAGLLCGAASAQTVLGSATEIQGLVTVSNGSAMRTAATGAPVLEGSHFVTSSGSFATLTLSNNCVLRMKPNQAITITEKKSCDELLALLESASRAGALALQGGAVSPVIGLGVIGAASVVAFREFDRRTGGSNTAPGGGGNTPTPGGGGGGVPTGPISPQ